MPASSIQQHLRNFEAIPLRPELLALVNAELLFGSIKRGAMHPALSLTAALARKAISFRGCSISVECHQRTHAPQQTAVSEPVSPGDIGGHDGSGAARGRYLCRRSRRRMASRRSALSSSTGRATHQVRPAVSRSVRADASPLRVPNRA